MTEIAYAHALYHVDCLQAFDKNNDVPFSYKNRRMKEENCGSKRNM